MPKEKPRKSKTYSAGIMKFSYNPFMSEDRRPKQDIPTILGRLKRPKKAVVTAGMPYANGPVHIGHLAGAHVPADIFSRWLGLLIGRENVLFVCGTDDHGSNSEVAANKQGISTAEFIDQVHASQHETMKRYSINLDCYSGTSRPENYETHKEYCQEILRKLYKNNFLEKKSSEQWFDPKAEMFLPDRFVIGTCPKCGDPKAYSDECDACGAQYDPKELIDPKSTVSDATPELKKTDHWYLDMWKPTDQMIEFLESKKKTWRKPILSEALGQVLPSVIFPNTMEEIFKSIRDQLPTHKSRYAPGKMVVVQFENLSDLEKGQEALKDAGVEAELQDGWAHRSITRDVKWGIPVPDDIDSTMQGKTFYVWPESLVAPISFTKVALKNHGKDPKQWEDYWLDPDAQVYQFLGIDNVFFYVIMQAAMWIGSQEQTNRLPIKGELQLTDIFSSYLLQVNGEKMSKSRGNFLTADELLETHGYTADQIRYFLAILSLSEKASNFDIEVLKERNKFLAGPLNAAFEKPISACHSKFNGKIPKGELIGKTEKETLKIVQTYCNFMSRAEYPKALFAVENYARVINGLFNQFKPHDDRKPIEERINALYSSFYILRNLVIMLHPFAPETIDKLRVSLDLPESIYSIDNLGGHFKDGHEIAEQVDFFPKVED